MEENKISQFSMMMSGLIAKQVALIDGLQNKALSELDGKSVDNINSAIAQLANLGVVVRIYKEIDLVPEGDFLTRSFDIANLESSRRI